MKYFKLGTNMTTNTSGVEIEYDVTIFGRVYRILAITRSKAVTDALKKFMEDVPDVNMPLSIIRKRAGTKVVDEEQELVQAHLESN